MTKPKKKVRRYIYLIDGVEHIGRRTNADEAHDIALYHSRGFSSGADARITVRKCEVIEETVYLGGEKVK